MTSTNPPISPLPESSAERKNYPVWSGALAYAPAAFALMARHSVYGNNKHNPGEPLHHARGKSADHVDCIVRHLIDYESMCVSGQPSGERLREELGALIWRTAVFVQEQLERHGYAPQAPRALRADQDPAGLERAL